MFFDYKMNTRFGFLKNAHTHKHTHTFIIIFNDDSQANNCESDLQTVI